LPKADLSPGAALIPEDNGGLLAPIPEQILREVQACIRKETRSRHALRILEHWTTAPIGANISEVCHFLPEVAGSLDGPRVQVNLRSVKPLRAAHASLPELSRSRSNGGVTSVITRVKWQAPLLSITMTPATNLKVGITQTRRSPVRLHGLAERTVVVRSPPLPSV